MPIIIDSTKDIQSQMQDLTKRLATKKSVDAKFFSKSLTGNGRRKVGLFAIDGTTIDEFAQNKMRLLDTVPNNIANTRNVERYYAHKFGNFFHQSTKPTKPDWEKFENNLTTMLPPLMIHELITSVSGSHSLTVPRDTAMYFMNDLDNAWFEVAKGTIDNQPATLRVRPIVQSMRVYAKESQLTNSASASNSSTTPKKVLLVSAMPEIYVLVSLTLDDMYADGDMIFTNHADVEITQEQGAVAIGYLAQSSRTDFSYNEIMSTCDNLIHSVTNKQKQIGVTLLNDLKMAIGDLSMYDLLSEQATQIADDATLEEALLTFVNIVAENLGTLITKEKLQNVTLTSDERDAKAHYGHMLIAFTQHLDLINDMEDDGVSTDLLSNVFTIMNQHITDPVTLNMIARHSLRLLLSKRLHELKQAKESGALYDFQPSNPQATQDMKANPNYSNQQKRIVMSTDPLVIGQAGAGSGKSHTLVGRINYLKDNGEDLSKVLVLSFTNVAAVNINHRFPGVRSETLANMFHTIYKATYPNQILSEPTTVSNALRLLNPHSTYFQNMTYPNGQPLDTNELEAFLREFADQLEKFDQTGFKRVNLQQELKHLSNLIETNLDFTELLLNAIEQTTLDIEPIIIHHRLLQGGHALNIPQEYRDLNYIITDESQDISTFEYILLLELTIHHGAQLLIIGDGSQTLYEFRNSDPRYMNALEASDVFVSHKLETNYRSRQEILTYANQFLQVIDANKYANIQLKSSAFTQPDVGAFKKAVTLAGNPLDRTSNEAYSEAVYDYIKEEPKFHTWFLDRVQRGEQVALMGWTRREVEMATKAIEELLADNNLAHIEITNIMSDSRRPLTILSRFAHDYRDEIRALDPLDPQYLDRMEELVTRFTLSAFNRSSAKQLHFYQSRILNTVSKVMNSHNWTVWLQDVQNGNITGYHVGSYLIQELLREETRHNRMEQLVKKEKEIPDYSKCPIIVSTIHGTKGLEFDHTIVLYNEAKPSSRSQEALRMMFVALSRAKKSEFILNSYKDSTATNARSIGNTLSDMLETPMDTAYLRSVEVIQEAVNQQAVQTNIQAMTGVAETDVQNTSEQESEKSEEEKADVTSQDNKQEVNQEINQEAKDVNTEVMTPEEIQAYMMQQIENAKKNQN